MAKDFAALHASANDSSALEQKVYVVEESVRGTLATPAGTDLVDTLEGASVNFTQPIESSPSRSGRHHNAIIKQKTTTEFSLPMFFNIDTSLGAVSNAEIDAGFRVLLKSLLGKETDNAGSLEYTAATAPDLSFSIYENGDQWAKQAPGGFVNSAEMSFPGDGDAQVEFSGNAKTALLVGIGKSTVDNNGANTVTLQAGEGERFPVGAQVMLVEADGTTRSADTPDGSPRTVDSVAGDVVTLDGAALADADGASADVYLVYYEPETSSSIRDPQTGLEGSITISGIPSNTCVRSLTLSFENNHELVDYCFGEDGLAGPLYVPGDRLSVTASVELNLDHDLVEFLNSLKDFAGDDIDADLGDTAGRHMHIDLPKVIFPIPEIAVPATGSIPVTFEGLAYETALEAADEVKISFL